MKVKKYILDPDKVSRVLGVAWKHPRIPDENDEYKKVRYEVSSFVYNLPNELVFSFDYYFDPYSIQLSSNKEKEFFTIFFGNITGVKYLFRYKILILENKQKDCFSQIWISAKGVFRIKIGIPISDYDNYAWINCMGDGKEEEIYRR